ncbi:hypothetical protein E2C01_086214 [Portunus trituberculatus]|uniref:Uncharacterized protein n=1 Tax=Portunus trituberculatus TaxID=210409 RepID=A0A5B7J926_PORTR|nr:hypothetical protein [Portunus trituberculatus]
MAAAQLIHPCLVALAGLCAGKQAASITTMDILVLRATLVKFVDIFCRFPCTIVFVFHAFGIKDSPYHRLSAAELQFSNMAQVRPTSEAEDKVQPSCHAKSPR